MTELKFSLVIAVNGRPLQEEAKAAGARAFFQKPFQMTSLVALLKKFTIESLVDEPVIVNG